MASKAAAKPLDVVEDPETGNRFIVYTTKAGVHMDVHFDGEEPWFTQLQIAEIFGVSVPTVNEHIAKFQADGELDEATVRKFRIVRQEGERTVSREIEHYGLDVAFSGTASTRQRESCSGAGPRRCWCSWPSTASSSFYVIHVTQAHPGLYIVVLLWPWIVFGWFNQLIVVTPLVSVYLGYRYGYLSFEVAMGLAFAFLLGVCGFGWWYVRYRW